MIKPISDFILVKELDITEEKVEGMVVLETSVSENTDSRLKKFLVVEISDGYKVPYSDTERYINKDIKPGSIVLMDKFAGKKFIENGTEFILVREAEIQAVFTKDVEVQDKVMKMKEED